MSLQGEWLLVVVAKFSCVTTWQGFNTVVKFGQEASFPFRPGTWRSRMRQKSRWQRMLLLLNGLVCQ
ncbi:hypothetical protein [Chitinophaga sp.]|uniref:hypothetical protein n=1 Tax=Chitinophaga sp. TaxID=1869181 RepID=UPI002FDC963F